MYYVCVDADSFPDFAIGIIVAAVVIIVLAIVIIVTAALCISRKRRVKRKQMQ